MSAGFSFPLTNVGSADFGNCFKAVISDDSNPKRLARSAISRNLVVSNVALGFAKRSFPLGFLGISRW